MILQILQYVTSGFWIFIGCTLFSTAVIAITGWALNALLIGIRGKKCDYPEILS